MLTAHLASQCFELRCPSNSGSYFKIIYLLKWAKLQPLGAFRELQILSCDSPNGCSKSKLLGVHACWLIILTSVGIYIWLFKRAKDPSHATHTEQKGGSCYGRASDRPINSCQSGNRPVNIEGPGRGGGNERKGQPRTIFSHILPHHLPPPPSSLPNNPASHSA